MVSAHDPAVPGRRPEWRRTPAQRRAADFRRFLLRNRFLVRLAVAACVSAIVGAAIGFGLPAAIGQGFTLAKAALGGSAGLKVEMISVQGLKHLSQDEVADALAISPDASLLNVDVTAARARVAKLGWVKDVTIQRVPPNRLHVSIAEREPRILWRDGRHYFVADETGHVIAPADSTAFSALFNVAGEHANEAAPELMRWLAVMPEIEQHVQSAEFIGDRRWNLHLSNQVVVELPDRGLDTALAVLSRMITKESLLKRDVTVVDLREPKEPRLRLGDEAARVLRAPKER